MQPIPPVPGTTKLHRLEENVGATSLELTAGDLKDIDEAASALRAEGDRHPPAQMAMLGRDAPEKAPA